jgi:signal transduction histidine kinase
VGSRLPERTDVVLGSPELVEQHRSALAGVPTRHAITLFGRSYEVTLEPVRAAEGAVTGAIGLLQDTTERRRLEEQLRHSQKMDAMGRLAGGVAHDFNNLLTVIVNCAALAKDTLPEEHEAVADMDEVLGAAQRAAELTGQLLAFSRRRTTQAVVIDVAKHLRSTTRMLERLIGEDVKLETHIAADVAAVRIDPGALEQVIVNLAVNARDAMPGGGRLLLDVTRIEVDRGWQDFRGVETAAGSYVRIVVNDTGCGMTPEVRARLFEPFFSTKGPGRGTGLGLATVYGIVTQAGGAIHVYTEPGRGSAFHVYLPRVGEAPT